MPELPEVETIRAELAGTLPGSCVREVWSHGSDKFTPARDALGTTIEEVRRRGKYLLVALDTNEELVIHLGMTGVLSHLGAEHAAELAEPGTTAEPHLRARWIFTDESTLLFHDIRRFGRLRVVPTGDYTSIATLAAIGPEPLSDDFTPLQLHAALSRSSRRIKTQLLSQRPVAGVGNIYADEALWESRIHPAARRISKPAADRLHGAIVDVMAAAIANRGTTLRDYRTASGDTGSNQHHLKAYGRGGEPCLRCGKALTSKVWDARTTTFCAACQNR